MDSTKTLKSEVKISTLEKTDERDDRHLLKLFSGSKDFSNQISIPSIILASQFPYCHEIITVIWGEFKSVYRYLSIKKLKYVNAVLPKRFKYDKETQTLSHIEKPEFSLQLVDDKIKWTIDRDILSKFILDNIMVTDIIAHKIVDCYHFSSACVQTYLEGEHCTLHRSDDKLKIELKRVGNEDNYNVYVKDKLLDTFIYRDGYLVKA